MRYGAHFNIGKYVAAQAAVPNMHLLAVGGHVGYHWHTVVRTAEGWSRIDDGQITPLESHLFPYPTCPAVFVYGPAQAAAASQLHPCTGLPKLAGSMACYLNTASQLFLRCGPLHAAVTSALQDLPTADPVPSVVEYPDPPPTVVEVYTHRSTIERSEGDCVPFCLSMLFGRPITRDQLARWHWSGGVGMSVSSRIHMEMLEQQNGIRTTGTLLPSCVGAS